MPTIEEVFKIQPLEIKPHTKLVKEEVKTTKMDIHVKIAKPQVGT